MNKWIKRVSTAVASTALAGGALLGVSGTASVATASAPGEHTQSASTAFATGGDRADGYQSAHHEAQDDSWGAPRGWYTNDDRQGHYGEERWNGNHVYVWDGYRWDEATAWHRVSAERWYLDQVACRCRYIPTVRWSGHSSGGSGSDDAGVASPPAKPLHRGAAMAAVPAYDVGGSS
ncbi:hypothetical protein [Streptomyces albiflavescens]|nr:hypothetical protein [Streptomyces albiflavescens]